MIPFLLPGSPLNPIPRTTPVWGLKLLFGLSLVNLGVLVACLIDLQTDGRFFAWFVTIWEGR